MSSTEQLIAVADAYKEATGIDRDQTVSYRAFKDSKKLAALRAGAGITVDRLNDTLDWFAVNWPAGTAKPKAIARRAPQPERAAE